MNVLNDIDNNLQLLLFFAIKIEYRKGLMEKTLFTSKNT